MTPIEQVTAIKNKLESLLPAALTTAGLQDFEDYLDHSPDDLDKRQLGVYQSRDRHSTTDLSRSFVIHCELPHLMNETAYHSVINPIIRQYVDADFVEMVDRDEIDTYLFPIEPRMSNAAVLYVVSFSEPLDDEDY